MTNKRILNNNNIISILFILCIFILSSCTNETCIDADDFGFEKFDVSARYNKSALSEQVQGNQIAPWVDSGYTVNGRPLALMIKTWNYDEKKNNPFELSAWCAWYGKEENTHTLSSICVRLRKCEFVDGQMCSNTKDARITNSPCLFKDGVGLYTLITTPYYDPNISFVSQRSPQGITFHMGEPTNGYKFYDITKDKGLREAGGRVYNYTANEKLNYVGGKLYFKILDKFYDDNSGQYKIVIKSGVSNKTPDPIEYLTLLVTRNLFGVNDKGLDNNQYNQIVQELDTGKAEVYKPQTRASNGIIRNIYTNIVNNPSYKLCVLAMLTLYVMFSGMSYLIGNINITNIEIIKRVFKVAIISVLLNSQYSWSFFNDFLFVFFVDGLQQLLGIIQDAGATGPGSSSILGLMMAPQTMAKLWSLLFIDWRGFLYIILFIIALFFIVMITFEASVLYLTSLITIGMIIIMGPIFLCFVLFEFTRSLFENWLKQLISYAFQPILLFTGIALISIILRTEIYSSLGFKVCRAQFPNLGSIFGIGDMDYGINAIQDTLDYFGAGLDVKGATSFLFWWFPNPDGGDFTQKRANIPVPYDHIQADDKYCQAYGCIENRYIELPFLDPEKDQSRIYRFFQGNFVQFDGLLLIFVCIYLLNKFNALSVSVSRFITGTSGNLTNIQKVTNDAKSAQSLMGPYYEKISNAIDRAYNNNPGVRKLRDMKDSVSNFLEQGYEDIQRNRLGNQALDLNKANPAVLEEVRKNYGIDARSLNLEAISQYKNAVDSKLKELNDSLDKDKKLSDSELSKKAEALASRDFKGLQEEYVKIKFGEKASYEKLTKEEKETIDKELKTTKEGVLLKSKAAEAKLISNYQKAYFDAHQDMSERGIGLFGKRISPLRKLEELKHKVDSNKELEHRKKIQKGEKIYAGYEGLKRSLIGKIAGKEAASYFGAAWHEMDLKDKMLRTYDETLRDNEKLLEHRMLNIDIEKARNIKNLDVISPEYIAKLQKGSKEYDEYLGLALQKLDYEVHNALISSEKTAIMGEKFMREKATDTQFKEMIDNSYKVRDDLLANSQYLSRQEYYEARNEEALSNIQSKYDLVKQKFDNKDIKIEELPKLLSEYYQKDKSAIDNSKINIEIENLQKSIQQYNYTAGILQDIEVRKDYISNKINEHVKDLNKYRKEAKMQEYIPSKEKTEVNFSKVKNLNDALRK